MTTPAARAEPALVWSPLRVIVCYASALLLTGAISIAWARSAGVWPAWRPLAWGWGIAAGYAASGLAIKWIGVGGSLTRFFFWAFLVNGVRAAILVTIVIAVHRSAMAPSPAFDVAIWTGFFSCLFAEVLVLHLSSVAGDRSGT